MTGLLVIPSKSKTLSTEPSTRCTGNGVEVRWLKPTPTCILRSPSDAVPYRSQSDTLIAKGRTTSSSPPSASTNRPQDFLPNVHLLKPRMTTPTPTRKIPNHSLPLGRSCRNMTAKMATSTRLNLSTGATFEASPICNARK